MKNLKSNIFSKIFISIKNYGISFTVNRILANIEFKFKNFYFQYITNSEIKFTKIYLHNTWGDNESVSGPGSTLECTENLRNKLPDLFAKFSIHSIVDAPCGDFNWMRLVLQNTQLKYIGCDIVKDLVQKNKALYQSHKISFKHLDITKESLLKSDLLICRDCLYHLSYQDISKVIENFISSNTSYILLTNHKNFSGKNKDIKTSGFREIDLFSHPFNFTKNYLFNIDDYGVNTPENLQEEMLLFSRDQVIESFKKSNFL